MDWDASTEGAFLSGEKLPPNGLAVTMTGIRVDEMDCRPPKTGKETVYIGSFSDQQLDWVINKTNRRFLKEECGITNANVNGFAPIALVLYPNQTNMGTGIRAVRREINPPGPNAAPVQSPAPPPQPSQPAATPPAQLLGYPLAPPADDVPF